MTGGANHDSSLEDSDLALSDLGISAVARLPGDVACEHRLQGLGFSLGKHRL